MKKMKRKNKAARRIQPKFQVHINQVILAGAICNVPNYLEKDDEQDLVSSMGFTLCYFEEEYNKKKDDWSKKEQFINCVCRNHQADYLHYYGGKHTCIILQGRLRQRDHPCGKMNSRVFIESLSIQWNLNHQSFYVAKKDLTIDEIFKDKVEAEDYLGNWSE